MKVVSHLLPIPHAPRQERGDVQRGPQPEPRVELGSVYRLPETGSVAVYPSIQGFRDDPPLVPRLDLHV